MLHYRQGCGCLFSKDIFFCEHSEKNPRRSSLTDCGSSQDNKTEGNWCCLSLQMGNVDISSICLTAESWHSLWEIILGGKETSQTPPLPLPWAPLGSHWVLWITSPGMSPLQSGVLHPFRRINVFLQPSSRARARDWGLHREQILRGYKGCWRQWGQAATPQPRRGRFSRSRLWPRVTCYQNKQSGTELFFCPVGDIWCVCSKILVSLITCLL